MKIFYTVNSDFASKKPPVYKSTLQILRAAAGKQNVFSPEERQFVKLGSQDEGPATKAVHEKEKQLKESDVVIADITNGTAGVGYFISTALYLKKPTLVLQDKKDTTQGIHDSITIGKNRLLTYKKYNSKDIDKTIADFLAKSKQKLDTKFILIIPAEIDRYLEWASDYKRMHKAQIVRTAVENHMENDSDWKEYKSEEM